MLAFPHFFATLRQNSAQLSGTPSKAVATPSTLQQDVASEGVAREAAHTGGNPFADSQQRLSPLTAAALVEGAALVAASWRSTTPYSTSAQERKGASDTTASGGGGAFANPPAMLSPEGELSISPTPTPYPSPVAFFPNDKATMVSTFTTAAQGHDVVGAAAVSASLGVGATGVAERVNAELTVGVKRPDGTSPLNGRYLSQEHRVDSYGTFLPHVAPPPPPPVGDDTPDVWFHEHQKQQQEMAEMKEEERVAYLKQKKLERNGGVRYKLGKLFSNAGAGVSGAVKDAAESREASVWDANIKRAKERLHKYWPYQDSNDFVVEYDCYGLHNNAPTRGHILLTNTSLLFLGKGPSDLVIVEDVPLTDIVSYSKGVSVPTTDKGCRWVMDLPNGFVLPDAVQVYTRQGVLFHFVDFSHSILKTSTSLPGTSISDGHDDVGAYDRFLNYFDHVWRAAQQPLVGEHAPSQDFAPPTGPAVTRL